tara:strand:+ start:357 stop:560 length:204 start_codon:yes stop_codon:yes gene_type:complete
MLITRSLHLRKRIFKSESVILLCFEIEKIKKVSVPCRIQESQVKTFYFGWILVLQTSQSTLISKTES